MIALCLYLFTICLYLTKIDRLLYLLIYKHTYLLNKNALDITRTNLNSLSFLLSHLTHTKTL